MYYDIAESGMRIKAERRRRGFTQDILSEKLNISVNGLAKIENGKNGASVDTLVAISALFGISMDYLTHGAVLSIEERVSILLKGKTEKQIDLALKILKGILENIE
ncbi:helix-turn-helix domain-containing protein [Anaerobium acetethylicum]|uniref:Helix-turn-helix n=1 Tax=Anaerobium acetethylicum TaxID=1619234 RepID=A0A1D3TXJ0_9FIRM|nr:helix-turn-helix transcriptional regulator [Anaerobium acetethylicum]SCP99070.1 Helix-turn-helix [Anaerobium acetethylicum]